MFAREVLRPILGGGFPEDGPMLAARRTPGNWGKP